jgi:hypothetical protein
MYGNTARRSRSRVASRGKLCPRSSTKYNIYAFQSSLGLTARFPGATTDPCPRDVVRSREVWAGPRPHHPLHVDLSIPCRIRAAWRHPLWRHPLWRLPPPRQAVLQSDSASGAGHRSADEVPAVLFTSLTALETPIMPSRGRHVLNPTAASNSLRPRRVRRRVSWLRLRGRRVRVAPSVTSRRNRTPYAASPTPALTPPNRTHSRS